MQTGANSDMPAVVSLERLLATNEAPLESETAALEATAASERDRVQQLRTALAELRAETERRNQELMEAENSVTAHSVVLSAARRMPAEILSEISSLTLPPIRRIDKKTAALGYFPLWSSITVMSGGAAACPPKAVETLLRRSGNASLTVTIDCGNGNGQSSDLLKSIDSCVTHSGRWRTLRLHLHETLAEGVFAHLASVKGRLGALRTLDIIYTSIDWLSNIPPFPVDIFSIAPNLYEVTLTGTCPSRTSHSHFRTLYLCE
ncbi:hypothetical protein B0H16DRAFT_1681717, partial [Mycena metata]